MNPVKHALKMDFNVDDIRQDFPILQQKINGNPLVYLDNGATSQKPRAVIDAISRYYLLDNANIHRGIHTLSERATSEYEKVRQTVREFINASYGHEVIFVRGATEAINLVAQTYGRASIHEGDEIIVSTMEHHSNIVPWQMLCEQTGAILKVVSINDAGELELSDFEQIFTRRTKLVALTHVSNALGTINPIKSLIHLSHTHGVPVLIDGAQAVPHQSIDVQDLDCDFYVFSGHKMYAPTGVGVLYAKEAILNAMPPYQGGGEMIRQVSFKKTEYSGLPHRFEAGTPNIAGVIGLGVAIEYLNRIGMAQIEKHEQGLLAYATAELNEISGLRIIGTASKKAAVISFVMDEIHPHDIGTVLDASGIAIRAGHHCAMPLMDYLGLPATARASFGLYNTREEIDALVKGLHHVNEVFG